MPDAIWLLITQHRRIYTYW